MDEDEIKEGEYIRTNYGELGNIIEVQYDPLRYVYDECGNIAFPNDIEKHSFEVIDLIKYGDRVNGIFIEGNKGKYLETLEEDYENSSLGHIEYIKIWPHEINTIVTKEQFKSMEYKVGE